MSQVLLSAPLLSARGLRLAFGGVKAADGIDLDVMEGEFLAIIGPNGAGKTTFINMSTGYLKPQGGEITFAGERILGLSPRAIVRRGVGRSFQLPQLFTEHTVLENAALAVASREGFFSALTPLLRPDAPARGKRDAADRLRPLLRRAHELGAHLHIDMESMDSRDAVLELILELLSEDEFRAGPSAGLVLQAYLRDSPDTLDVILDWVGRVERAQPLTVRLVKGAYWDHEIVQARQHGWDAPVFDVKADCDLNFEALTRRLLDARPAVRVAIASHNLRSVSHAIAYNRLSGGSDDDLEMQVLRGLGDPLQTAIARQGLRVRTYCPVGDLVAGMAYLVRRLLENTSNESFLAEQARGAALDELLAKPAAQTAGM